jgi:hypothetical protein
LKLNNGKVLSNVKIRHVGETLVHIIHDAGAMRLSQMDLPAEWSDRFQIQPPLPPEPKADTTSEGSTSSASTAKVEVEHNASEIADMEAKISSGSAQIRLLRAQAAAWERQAVDYENKQANARSGGRIGAYGPLATQARAESGKASAAADAMQLQLNAMSRKLARSLDKW